MPSFVPFNPDDPLTQLLNLHEVLEVEHQDGNRGNFLFGWQCENPFAIPLLSATKQRAELLSHTQYSYLEEDEELVGKIKQAHQQLDGAQPQSVFCGAGATALLATFAAYMKRLGHDEIYFIPPLYFSFHFALKLFGIRARPISGRHAFEQSFKMNLPQKSAVLVLTDPIWYVGLPIPQDVMKEIARWQQATGSVVFVDGSFQYMPWTPPGFEATAHLDPSSTVRLISPTKSLAIHGYRFAYLSLPSSWRTTFSHTYTNFHGSAAVDSVAFAHEAVPALADGALTRSLIQMASERHRDLRAKQKIESALQPNCGYFVFEKLNAGLPAGYVTMGGEYFDQPRYEGYKRINLLSPSFSILSSAD